MPIIYLAEEKDGQLVVVDGQQRLQSIIYFINGRFGASQQKFKLDTRYLKTYLAYDLGGRTFAELPQNNKDDILNYELTISVIKKESKPDLKYEMFFRLNQGAMPLNDMEMRISQFQGECLEFLKKLAADPNFMELTAGVKDTRLKNIELVLEFFAFYEIYGDFKKYKSPKKFFLNFQMEKYKDGINELKIKEFEKIFRDTFRFIRSMFVDHAFNQIKVHKVNGEKYYSKVFNNFLYNIITMVFVEYIDDSLWFEKNSKFVRDSLETFLIGLDSTKHDANHYEKAYNDLKILINGIRQKESIEAKYNLENIKKNSIDDYNKVKKTDFLEYFQWFEGNIVVKKFKMNTVGEFLRDKPYLYPVFSSDRVAKNIIENQAIIAKTNSLRNFITHQDPNYAIKDDDYKNWAEFVGGLKKLLDE